MAVDRKEVGTACRKGISRNAIYLINMVNGSGKVVGIINKLTLRRLGPTGTRDRKHCSTKHSMHGVI